MFHDSQRVVDVVGFSWTFLEGKVQTSWCATWSSHWDTRLQRWSGERTDRYIQCNTTCALTQLGIISQDMYINNSTNFTVDSCIYVDPPTGRRALLCQHRLINMMSQVPSKTCSFQLYHRMICLFLMYCVTKEGDDKWWYRYFPANGGGRTHAHSAKVMLQILLTGVPLFQDGSCDMYWYHMW